MLGGIVDLSIPVHEGTATNDLGPKFWVRLSHVPSRQLHQYTQFRGGASS